ncbi:hypothetical protein SmJEL517_g00945 [Synchytrium microbalum]|uniref:Protein kinase domain-containing protein n=1 Tax=Synchytrium microbalum TaxID=1806994 RepID=A0A507C7U7_9FUNG|nr:uncharacterized protein SmJEL517_g00945 [Synchytrium microbalum]TPX37127.1 hypothetical protein SmJEL517_g00945 [Synchytrium microbalum]
MGGDSVASMLKRSTSVKGEVDDSEDSLQISMNYTDYEIGTHPIGYGSSAVVYMAMYKPLRRHVAIKLIELDQFERNQIEELRKEIQIMSLCKHPNLLRVYGSFVHDAKLYIVTPFLSAGSCLDIMKTAYPDGMEEAAIATILKQALAGLEYLHANKLIHRDVKAGNLLMASDGTVQLADFGVSSSLTDTGERKGVRKTFVGTPCWMAPEVMEQNGYDYKADIWSFGITALELANGHAPFAKYPPLKVLMLTLQQDPPTLDINSAKHKYTKAFKEMIDSCLQKDPTKRPTPDKLIQHAFFKNSAKKPEYLAKTLIQNLPPISQRPHNTRPSQPPRLENRGVVWDFSGDEPVDNNNTLSSMSSQTSSTTSSHDALPKSVHTTGSGDVPVKKSRFVIDSISTDTQNLSTSPAGSTPLSDAIHGEIKKGRFSVSEVSSDAGSRSNDSSPQLAPVSSIENMGSLERKAGRFAIQELPPSHLGSSVAHDTSFRPTDKKSRFEVSDSPATSGGEDNHSIHSSPSTSPYKPSSSTQTTNTNSTTLSQAYILQQKLETSLRKYEDDENTKLPQEIWTLLNDLKRLDYAWKAH